ncbi:MAG TPA: FKBP-type peptidyl-prolyl cis-trans isomerase [Panacibacter sp.]|nr:FKBP-type peptidyl-prolyl cis-trans isomerase [Panacibacter sp.]
MKKILLAAAAALSLAACQQVNYEKAPSGLAYKIFPGKGGDSVKVGEFVKYNVEYLLTGRTGKADSVLQTTYDKMPGFGQVDTGARAAYSILEIMTKLRTGDSAVAILNSDTLKKKNQLDPNDSIVFTKGSSILCKIMILKTFKNQTDIMAEYQKEMELENKRETKSVEDYMAQKGIKGIKTKSGAFVLIENPGDTTNKADSGKIAAVKYKGYLQSNGKVFDTNFDSTNGHGTDPYPVLVGTRSVITGWDEALPYFGKGGSGKIFVPAFLGYGPQASGEIPPNSNLVFEVQIVDVKEAPPAAKNAIPGFEQPSR